MGVEGAAVTSAEAAQYRAAGWWTDTTLSECVVRNAVSLCQTATPSPVATPNANSRWARLVAA